MRKKIIILLMLVCSINSFAQSFTPAQENLRKDISTFLTRKGFNPETQSDGLKFKSEGVNYYVEIDKNDSSPMFLRLCRYAKYDNQLTREKVLKNLNSYNVKYGVKVSCQDKSVLLSCEMFVMKSEDFTYVFDTALLQMKSTYKKITE